MAKKSTHTAVTAGCLFAGIGGFCAGLKSASVKVLWANEKNEYASQTYAKNYPGIRLIQKDIKNFSVIGDKLEPVDILTAGFPCQSFSVAGERKGFDDERGQLFYQIVRIIKEFGDQKPSVLLLENVPNLRYGKGGVWFEEVVRNIKLAGYWLGQHNCKVLNTAEITHLPHRRDRLFMVALAIDSFDCNDFNFPLPNGKPLGLGNLVDKTKKKAPDNYMEKDNRYCKIIKRKMDEGEKGSIYQLRRSYAREHKNECPTLTANMGGGGHNVPFVKDRWGIRRLTVEEYAKFQGLEKIKFPDSIPEKEMYRQIGNAVTVPVAEKLAKECVRILITRGGI